MNIVQIKKSTLILYLVTETFTKLNVAKLNEFAKSVSPDITFVKEDAQLLKDTVSEYNKLVREGKSKAEIIKMYPLVKEENELDSDFEIEIETPTKKTRSRLVKKSERVEEMTEEEKKEMKKEIEEDLKLKKSDREAWEKKRGYKPGQEARLLESQETDGLMLIYNYQLHGTNYFYNEAIKYGLDPERKLTDKELMKIQAYLDRMQKYEKEKDEEKHQRKLKKIEKESKLKVDFDDDEEKIQKKREYEEQKLSDSTKAAEYSLFLYYESLYKENKSKLAENWLIEHGYELPTEYYEDKYSNIEGKILSKEPLVVVKLNEGKNELYFKNKLISTMESDDMIENFKKRIVTILDEKVIELFSKKSSKLVDLMEEIWKTITLDGREYINELRLIKLTKENIQEFIERASILSPSVRVYEQNISVTLYDFIYNYIMDRLINDSAISSKIKNYFDILDMYENDDKFLAAVLFLVPSLIKELEEQELKKVMNQILSKSDLGRLSIEKFKKDVLDYYKKFEFDLFKENKEELNQIQKMKKQYGESAFLTKKELFDKLATQQMENFLKSKKKIKDEESDEEKEIFEMEKDVLYPTKTELKKLMSKILYKSDLEKLTVKQFKNQVLEYYKKFDIDLLKESEEELNQVQRMKEQYGESEFLTKKELFNKLITQQMESVWTSKQKRKDNALQRKLNKEGLDKLVEKIEDEELEIEMQPKKGKKEKTKISVPKTIAKEFKKEYEKKIDIKDKILVINEKIADIDTKHQFAKLKLQELLENPLYKDVKLEDITDEKVLEKKKKLMREIENNKEKFKKYAQDLEPLLEQRDQLYEQLNELPLAQLIEKYSKKEEKDKKPKLTLRQSLIEAEEKIKKELDKQLKIQEYSSETNTHNISYLAFLSYYVVNYLLIIEDPTLVDTFKEYPLITKDFISNFLSLSVPERYRFIEKVFDNETYESIVKRYEDKQNILGLGIDDILKKYVTEKLNKTINDEIDLNTMYYFLDIANITNESETVDIIYDKMQQRKVELDEKSKDYIMVKVLDITKGVVDNVEYFSNVHKYQEKNLKKFVKNQTFITSNKLDDEEEQHKLQKLYEVFKPPVEILFEEQDIYPEVRQHNINLLDLLIEPAMGTEEKKDVKQTKKYKLQYIAKVFGIPATRNSIYKLLKLINNEIGNKLLSVTERKETELNIIEKLFQAKEISKTIYDFSNQFIEFYNTLQNLPKTRFQYSMFDYKTIESLPPSERETVFTRLKRVVRDTERDKFMRTEDKRKFTSITSKIQYELEKTEKDLEKLADLINSLDIKEEYKAKMLYLIENGEWQNVYVIISKVNPYVTKKLLNPLEYLGIQRNKRVFKLKDRQMALYRYYDASNETMISDTLKKCMQLQLLRPWTTIPKNARYFIADANHRDKFDLDDEQQVFFGDKIMIKEVEDKNYYYPTLLFWKTYCVSNFMKTDSEIKCNYEHLISRMTSKGGSSQQFILGVFDKDFYESAESTKKALMLNEEIYKKQIERSTDEKVIDSAKQAISQLQIKLNTFNEKYSKVFVEFGEEDYKKECEWYDTNYSDKNSFISLAKTNLSVNRKIREKARENGVNMLKEYLVLFYKNINSPISSEHIERLVMELERAIYDISTIENSDIRPLYLYFKILNEFIMLFDAESPMYEYAEYFQSLFLMTPIRNYKPILKLSLIERVPQLYLLADKREFMTIFNNIIDKKVEQDIRHIFYGFDSSIKKIKSEATFWETSNLKNEIISIGSDISEYKNICMNYDSVKDPYVLFQFDNNQLYCVGREQVSDIMNNNISKVQDVPDVIKNKVRELFIEGDDKDFNIRLYKIRNEAKYYALKYKAELLELQNIYKGLFGQDEELIDSILYNVNSLITPPLSEKETEMFIEQLHNYSYQSLIRTIQKYIDIYWLQNENILNPLLVDEKKRRASKYENNTRIMLEDRDERRAILAGLFDFINQSVYYEGEQVENSIIDYVSQYKIKVESDKPKEVSPEGPIKVVHGYCQKCVKPLYINNFLRTYVTEMVKVGGKLVSKNTALDFCSRSCFGENEEVLPNKEELSEIMKQNLVRDLIQPYMTYNQLVSLANEYGLMFPEGTNYNKGYVTLLLNNRFDMESPEEMYPPIVEDRKDIILKLAASYNIDTTDRSLNDVIRKLRENDDFESIWTTQTDMFVNQSAKLSELHSQLKQKYKEIYADGCSVDKEDVDTWINNQAKYYATDISSLNFEAFFKQFFSAFSTCQYLANSVKEAVKARGIESSLKTIIEIYYKTENAELSSLLKEYLEIEKVRKIDTYKSRIIKAEVKRLEEENQKLDIISRLDERKLKKDIAKKIEESSNSFLAQAEQKLKQTDIDKIEATLYKNIEILTKIGKGIKGSKGKEQLQFLLRELEDIRTKAKYKGEQVDSNKYYDIITDKFDISLGSSNTTIFTYKALLMKVGNQLINTILDNTMEVLYNEFLVKEEIKPAPKSKGRKLTGVAKLDSEKQRIGEEMSKYQEKIDELEKLKTKSLNLVDMYSKTLVGGKIVPSYKDMILKENEVIKQIDEKMEEYKEKIAMSNREIEEKNKEIKAIQHLNSASKANQTKVKKLTQAQKALIKEELENSQPTEQQKESLEEAVFISDKLKKLKKQLVEQFTKYIDNLRLPLTKEEKQIKKAEEMKQQKPVELDVEIEDDTPSFFNEEFDNQKEIDREVDDLIAEQEKQLNEDYEQEYGREEEGEYDVEEDVDYGDGGDRGDEDESESFF